VFKVSADCDEAIENWKTKVKILRQLGGNMSDNVLMKKPFRSEISGGL
jgi:hypothetical protein